MDRASSTIGEVIKRYRERILEPIRDQNGGDLSAQLVRLYEPNLVRKVTGSLMKDETELRTQSAHVRLALIERLGDHPDFAIFNRRIGVSEFIDIVDKESAANSQTARNNLLSNPRIAPRLSLASFHCVVLNPVWSLASVPKCP